MKKINVKTIASDEEKNNRESFLETFRNCPLPENELISNLGLFEKRQEFAKKLFFYEIYRKILNIHGDIIEFGTRWGQNLVTLNNLRGILEPYNYSRKIIGFDTFEGFRELDKKDGTHEIIKEGAFNVTDNYESYIKQVLEYHETESPLSHIKKNFVIKGDASVKLKEYLINNPQTIIAFAYFDFDLYSPTLKCLDLIKNHITKGTVIGFDELNDPHFPGETVALMESFGIKNVTIRRFSFCGIQSYLIIE